MGIPMVDSNATMWGLHAGRTGDADQLFFGRKRVAIGWAQMGDLSLLEPDREAFKARYVEAYPDDKPGAVPVNAGQLYRFVHEVGDGDIVIYPRKLDRSIQIGRISGPYQYEPSSDKEYVHQRPVEWLKSFERTDFSQGALYEIGSAMSLFQVKNFADEFWAALTGERLPTVEVDDDSVEYVAEKIQETTEDFILKQPRTHVKGHAMEGLTANLLRAMGYHAEETQPSRDDGIDVIAHKDQLGLEPPIIKVQVKSEEGNIGPNAVKALYAMVEEREVGLFVTLGGFTRDAERFASSKSNLRLIGGGQFVEQILQHYDRLDLKFKNLIPLQQVYVPQPKAEDD